MASIYQKFGQKAFFSFDAETAHGLSIQGLKLGAAHLLSPFHDVRLEQSVAGLHFPNPIGLAAGYDKNADVPFEILRLGFGFAEVGTLTPLAQPGNPKPRIFRLPKDEAVINRLGFNNDGHTAALLKLEKMADRPGLIGVNIGANKDSSDRTEDYVAGIARFYHVARYFTVNISSPNTPGLRDLQARETLADLLARTTTKRDDMAQQTGRTIPIFLKIAPDLTEEGMDDIAEEVLQSQIDGVIISNTTITRPELYHSDIAQEAGGLSGQPVFHLSNIILAKMRERLRSDIAIIGVGGVKDAETAAEKLRAGADLVQLYTGLIYQGPGVARNIAQGLAAICDRDGLSNISELKSQKLSYYAGQKVPD